jgi:hypothetical protein
MKVYVDAGWTKVFYANRVDINNGKLEIWFGNFVTDRVPVEEIQNLIIWEKE